MIESLAAAKALVRANQTLGAAAHNVDEALKIGPRTESGNMYLGIALNELRGAAGTFDETAGAIRYQGTWPNDVHAMDLIDGAKALRRFATQLEGGAMPFTFHDGVASAQRDALRAAQFFMNEAEAAATAAAHTA